MFAAYWANVENREWFSIASKTIPTSEESMNLLFFHLSPIPSYRCTTSKVDPKVLALLLQLKNSSFAKFCEIWVAMSIENKHFSEFLLPKFVLQK